jgi:hypothetical protein
MLKVINKGTGAGGSMTTINGGAFENKTSIEDKLLENKFEKIIMDKSKYGYYYQKTINKDNKLIYLTQGGFKLYCMKEFKLNNIYRKPDEAFILIIKDVYYIKILEKKNQNVEGSVEDKLKTGAFNRREYEKMFKNVLKTIPTEIIDKSFKTYHINISYAFCVSKFLQNKFESKEYKYVVMKEIMMEDNIHLFYGDDDNYFDKLFEWIYNKSELIPNESK